MHRYYVRKPRSELMLTPPDSPARVPDQAVEALGIAVAAGLDTQAAAFGEPLVRWAGL